MKFTGLFAILTVIAVMTAASNASAQLEFLDAVDSGNYRWDGYSSGGSTNYAAGDTAAAGVSEIRNFFVFDLSAVQGTVAHAALQLYNPGNPPDTGDGFNSPDPYETYVLKEVTTDIAALMAGGTGLIAVFDDLGDGPVFGTVDADIDDNATCILIPLNPSAVAAINSAVGGLWAVGGSVTTLDGNPLQTVFAYSNGTMRRRLILDLGGTVFWDDFESGRADRWQVGP